MHGILAAFNEYRSNSDVADIRYKMGQMTKNGGTLGQAKFGYLNVRERSTATKSARWQLTRNALSACGWPLSWPRRGTTPSLPERQPLVWPVP